MAGAGRRPTTMAPLPSLGVTVNRGVRYARALGLAVIVIAVLCATSPARTVVAQPVLQEAHRPPVEVTVVAKKYSFSPARIEVEQDDIIKVTLKTEDIPHSFTIDQYRISKRVAPGQPVTFEIHADQAGTFTYYCSLTSDERCKEMRGELVVHAKR